MERTITLWVIRIGMYCTREKGHDGPCAAIAKAKGYEETGR